MNQIVKTRNQRLDLIHQITESRLRHARGPANTNTETSVTSMALPTVCPKKSSFLSDNCFIFHFQFIMGFESTYLWEKPIPTGIVFGSVLALLLSICYYSLISVAAYASLTLLLVNKQSHLSLCRNYLGLEIFPGGAKIYLEPLNFKKIAQNLKSFGQVTLARRR